MGLPALQAQTPQGLNYQAVLRDGTNIMANQPVDFRFSIHQDTVQAPLYQEIHATATNSYGLVNLVIGHGQSILGDFPTIDWKAGNHYLKVEVDKGLGYIYMGTNQLVSVPYSLLSLESESIEAHSLSELADVSSSIPSSGDVLKWNGSSWEAAPDAVGNGGTTVSTTSRISGDGSTSNPLDLDQQGASTGQLLKWNGTAWTPDADETQDSDADPTNEIQTITLTNHTLTLSGGGGSVSLDTSHWVNAGNHIYYDGGVRIGSSSPMAPEAFLQLNLLGSGNFPHFRLENTTSNTGFGMAFSQPDRTWFIGQNIGNWNDGRFQIASDSNNHWMTMLPNGNVGLTRTGFTTPLARFQVPQNGDMDNGGVLSLTQAALYIGENNSDGIAFDHDQIEGVGSSLKINSLSDRDISLASGGGQVGVAVTDPRAPFHVAEGKSVLFGADTSGKSNFYPDAKLMFLPGRGGAFRVGQLNADGSIIGGTGWNFWNHSKIGWASVAIGNNTKASGAGSVALGIRAQATNFGSVALGHLSRTIGNSAVSAGYYTRADAFVSTAVGAGNVGGGNMNAWVYNDPIFEVGNSTDTTNRSNAFTVLKNARVGINTHNPQSMLDIEQPNPGPGNGVFLNLAGIGHWETSVDNSADYNFYFNNALKSYILDSDGTYFKTSDRRLKRDIESIDDVLPSLLRLTPSRYRYIDAGPESPVSIGFIAQDVQPLFPDLVSEKNDYLGINYSGFSVITVKAIQEQQELINEQASQIADLQREVEALKKILEEIVE